MISGGTKIAAGAVTENGAILSRFECPTAPWEGFAAAIERTEMLREAGRLAGWRGSIRMLDAPAIVRGAVVRLGP